MYAFTKANVEMAYPAKFMAPIKLLQFRGMNPGSNTPTKLRTIYRTWVMIQADRPFIR